MALDFQSLSPRNQWLVVGGICAGLIFVFYQQIWAPNAVDIEEMDAEIRQLESEIQRVQRVATRLPELEEEMGRLESDLELLGHILPEEREEDQLLRRVEAVAAESNLNVRKFTFQPPVPHEFYAEYPLELELVGTYHDLARFFDRIAKFARIINVDSIRISTFGGEGSATVQATCRAMTFIFLEEEEEVTDPETTADGAPVRRRAPPRSTGP